MGGPPGPLPAGSVIARWRSSPGSGPWYTTVQVSDGVKPGVTFGACGSSAVVSASFGTGWGAVAVGSGVNQSPL